MLNHSNKLCGVLLLAHGGPDSLEDIEPFLINVRGGRKPSPELLRDITERYRLIGGRSPLIEITRRQALALQERLNREGLRFRVYVGMRNWHPFIHETMRQIVEDQIDSLLAICLAPQNSRLSVGLYFEQVREAQQQLKPSLQITYVESWSDNRLLLEAFAEKVNEALCAFPEAVRDSVTIIFTAHSLPERIIREGDPYESQAKATAEGVAELVGHSRWRFAYQSQGATQDKWLGPTVESTIQELAAQGCRHVLVAPIGFVSDHIEVLYDIDIAFRKFAEARGVELRRTESLNDSPAFIEALASVVREHLLLVLN